MIWLLDDDTNCLFIEIAKEFADVYTVYRPPGNLQVSFI